MRSVRDEEIVSLVSGFSSSQPASWLASSVSAGDSKPDHWRLEGHTYEAGVRAAVSLALVVEGQHRARQEAMQHLALVRVIIQTGGRLAAVGWPARSAEEFREVAWSGVGESSQGG